MEGTDATPEEVAELREIFNLVDLDGQRVAAAPQRFTGKPEHTRPVRRSGQRPLLKS